MTAPVEPTSLDRLWNSFRALVRAESPTYTFSGIYEYGIQAVHGSAPNTTVDCSPTDTSIPLPPLVNITMRAGNDGNTSTPSVGSNCLVMFINADPSRPVIIGTEPVAKAVKMQASGSIDVSAGAITLQGGATVEVSAPAVDVEGTVTILLNAPIVNIATGVLQAARVTDTVVAGPFAGTITGGSMKVLVG